MRNNVTFFRSQFESIENLPNAEDRADAYKTVFEYAFNNNDEYTENPLSKALLTAFKPVFDKQRELSKKRAEAGKKGGEISKRKANVSKREQDKDKDKDKDIKEKIYKKENFQPPNVEDVRIYCQEKGYNFDPELFVSFYESKGWMIGKNKMKSWKSACATWNKNSRADSGADPTWYEDTSSTKADKARIAELQALQEGLKND